MIGFNIKQQGNFAGIQIATQNNCNVTMYAYNKSSDHRVEFEKCVVLIDKEDHLGKMQDITPNIMEKMNYTPTAEEIKKNCFIVNLHNWIQILNFVRKLDVQ